MDFKELLGYCKSRYKVYINYKLDLKNTDDFEQKLKELYSDIFDDLDLIFNTKFNQGGEIPKVVSDSLNSLQKLHADTLNFYRLYKELH